MTKQKAFFISFGIPLVLFVLSLFESNGGDSGNLFAWLYPTLLIISLFLPALIIGRKFGKEFRQNGLYGALMSTVLIMAIYYYHLI
ncbi:MAG: hypothetical protein ACYC6X_01875 [Minisyncoccota bacterium]